MRANDAWSAVAELAASQHGAFSRRQAAELHISNHRLRTAVAHGLVRSEGRNAFCFRTSPTTWRQRLFVVTLAGPVISHRSAAALHKLDGCEPGPVEATGDRSHNGQVAGAIVHRLAPLDPSQITTVDGIRCTNVATTLCYLGAVLGRDEVEKALDSALRRGLSQIWIDRTLESMRANGRSGTGVLRSILADPARNGRLPDSWFERLLARIASISGLPTPVLQFEVTTALGVRRPDLAFPGVKLGIEGHSRIHHFGVAATRSDHQRDLALAAVGWEIIYITWAMAADPVGLANQIAEIYHTRARQIGLG